MADPTMIRCRENGPLVIQGIFKVVDHLGNEFPRTPGKEQVSLCRCGQTKNRPFCDGSHKECGFVGAELAPAPAATPAPAPPPAATPPS